MYHRISNEPSVCSGGEFDQSTSCVLMLTVNPLDNLCIRFLNLFFVGTAKERWRNLISGPDGEFVGRIGSRDFFENFVDATDGAYRLMVSHTCPKSRTNLEMVVSPFSCDEHIGIDN